MDSTDKHSKHSEHSERSKRIAINVKSKTSISQHSKIVKQQNSASKSNQDTLEANKLIDSLRFSIRISPKSVSSVSIKKNIISLWILMTVTPLEKDLTKLEKIHKNYVTDFIYSCLNRWKGNTAKGFSDFVTEGMIRDILDKKDFSEYRRIKNILGK